MKKDLKLIVPAALFMLVVSACSTMKNTTQTASKKDIKGTWMLDSITYVGLAANEKINVNLFDDANVSCFTGSIWVLPNNGYGSYNISQTTPGCSPGQRNIIWSYNNDNGSTNFQFKKLLEGDKAKNVADGYKMNIISVTNEAMQLQSQLAVGGGSLTLNYNFTKK